MARDYSKRGARPVQSAPTILTNPGSSLANQWFGSTRITSAAGNIWFIPAGAVQSNGFIDFNVALATLPGSETAFPQLVVRSVSVGSGFYLGFGSSCATIVGTYAVNWKIDTRS